MKNKESDYIKEYKRKSVFAELNHFCVLSKDNDYIEITEWHNGEGFDINICSNSDITFSITYGQFKAIKKLIKKLWEIKN